MKRAPLTTLGLVAVSAALLAAAAIALLLIGMLGSCAGQQRKFYVELPPPTRAREAFLVAHAILGSEPGWVAIRGTMRVQYIEPNCQAPSGLEGFGVAWGGPDPRTGSCVGGAAASSIDAAVVWPRGMTLADSELAHEMYHMWEMWKYGAGDKTHAGPRWVAHGDAETKIAEIRAALRASGM